DPIPGFDVTIATLAAEQAAWIEAHTGLDIAERIRATLALGPAPHPYRRIRRDGNLLQLAIKEWRVRFSAAGRAVRVIDIRSGYRASQLDPARSRVAKSGGPAPPVHREFVARFTSG
ncbi:MAG: tRNA (N6-threonylcarbamoyladenosine(37)-N6)-methyltransferase TrmO, partial [Proteobacteria bacterium]|nr:tRNA (N6-threonylcarbamoyladenosine(37)-N6)-methyltransferase TrmO [Pseudomonadota bacterium]